MEIGGQFDDPIEDAFDALDGSMQSVLSRREEDELGRNSRKRAFSAVDEKENFGGNVQFRIPPPPSWKERLMIDEIHGAPQQPQPWALLQDVGAVTTASLPVNDESVGLTSNAETEVEGSKVEDSKVEGSASSATAPGKDRIKMFDISDQEITDADVPICRGYHRSAHGGLMHYHALIRSIAKSMRRPRMDSSLLSQRK